MLGVVSQQCCFRLNVVAKRLTGFKRCATTPNNTAQQHATEWANGRNMQHPTMLGVVCRLASVYTRLFSPLLKVCRACFLQIKSTDNSHNNSYGQFWTVTL